MEPSDAALAPTEPPGPSGVCVAVRDLRAVKTTSESPGELLPSLAGANLAWVNFAVDDLGADAVRIAGLFGFSAGLIETLVADPTHGYEDRDNEFGIRMPMIRVRAGDVSIAPLLVLCRAGFILTLHTRGRGLRMVRFARYADTFMRKIPADRPIEDRVTLLLSRILSENNERNFEGLRLIQEQGDFVSSSALEDRDPIKMGLEVHKVKHNLIVYLNGLWQLLDVLHNLRYGDAELISNDELLLSRVEHLVREVNRQIQLAEQTSKLLSGGLDVLQAVYNNQLSFLSNRMGLLAAWLSILGTAGLIPNTMSTILGPITSYSGRALIWYATVYAVATVASTAGVWWFIRKKGFLRVAPE